MPGLVLALMLMWLKMESHSTHCSPLPILIGRSSASVFRTCPPSPPLPSRLFPHLAPPLTPSFSPNTSSSVHSTSSLPSVSYYSYSASVSLSLQSFFSLHSSRWLSNPPHSRHFSLPSSLLFLDRLLCPHRYDSTVKRPSRGDGGMKRQRRKA